MVCDVPLAGAVGAGVSPQRVACGENLECWRGGWGLRMGSLDILGVSMPVMGK